jgi:subtilisin family serine protease
MLGWLGGRSSGRRRRCWAVVAATTLVVLAATAPAQASSRHEQAPVHMAQTGGIAGQYIVVLKGDLPSHPTERSEKQATAEDERVASSVKATPLFDYNADLRGFAADLTRVQLFELRHSPEVKYVDQDERVTETATQTAAPWDLDRIDQSSLPLNGTYDYSSEGAGVTVYVIDTGIQTNNVDFGSRARFGVNTVDRDDRDCNGHGTHVAGTAGGTKYGVAKLAKLVSVKALNCGGSGTMAGIVAAANWVTEHHLADKSVANMSLGGGKTQALNDAVAQLIESGVFVSAAAGNNNQNACNFSPASTSAAFTVAASDSSDRKGTFSNHGPCVDAYAPGVAIPSDWIGSPTATNTISGTSMAAPVVAGIAALYLSDHASTPAATATWIADHATTGVITGNPANTVNRLVDMTGL